MKHLTCVFIAVFCWTVSPVSAEETDTCERGTIASIARELLDESEEISILKRRRLTEDAPYLLIKHGDLSGEEIDALLDEEVTRRVRRSEELRLTYRLVTGRISPEEIDTLPHYPSMWRAMILVDDGERFFELARRELEDAKLGSAFAFESMVAYYAVRLLFDVSDEKRANVAATAERMGEIHAALELLADQSNLDAFRAIKRRYPDHPAFTKPSQSWTAGGGILRQQSSVWDWPEGIDESVRPYIDATFQIERADMRLGRLGFLTGFLNRTGKELEIGAVAQSLNAMLDHGLMTLPRDLHEARVFLYGDLVERFGQKQVGRALTFSGGERPHLKAHLVDDAIHWDIAARVLKDFVASEVSDPPEIDPLLPAEFDWGRGWKRPSVCGMGDR